VSLVDVVFGLCGGSTCAGL